VKNI